MDLSNKHIFNKQYSGSFPFCKQKRFRQYLANRPSFPVLLCSGKIINLSHPILGLFLPEETGAFLI